MEQRQAGGPGASYVLGHAHEELDRLMQQARVFADLTTHLLRLAGLEPGMRVLDVGCGPGDVTFLAASLVGPQGTIIGVDKSPEAIALARRRAHAAALTNVRFLVHDLATLTLDAHVDALIGRLVLMYVTEPAVVVRRLAGFVRPGGLVVFQEMDMEAAKSEPPCALFETAVERIWQTFRRAGVDVRACLKLAPIFRAAGLAAPRMIQGARVESGADSAAYATVAQITRTLLPLMQQTGVATAAEVDVESLAERLRAEAVAQNAVLVLPPFIGAWARTGEA